MKRYVNKIPVEIQLKKLLKRKFYIEAIETGTIRNNNPEHLSTLRIAKILEGKGKLISVDNNKPFIDFSRNICKEVNNVIWILDDALMHLKKYPVNCFDFLLIDTFNEKQYCFDQFIEGLRIVRDDGIIMVDDAGLTEEQRSWQDKPEKAHLIVKYLNDRLLPYTLQGNMFIFDMKDLEYEIRK